MLRITAFGALLFGFAALVFFLANSSAPSPQFPEDSQNISLLKGRRPGLASSARNHSTPEAAAHKENSPTSGQVQAQGPTSVSGTDRPSAPQAPSNQSSLPQASSVSSSDTTSLRPAASAATQSLPGAYSPGTAPAPQPGSFASTNPAASQAGDISVPPGASVPVAFLDAQSRPEPQRRALERIQRKFAEEIQAAGGAQASQEIWAKAKEHADRQYIKFFGFAAYNQLSIQAAKEALAERKATMENP